MGGPLYDGSAFAHVYLKVDNATVASDYIALDVVEYLGYIRLPLSFNTLQVLQKDQVVTIEVDLASDAYLYGCDKCTHFTGILLF